MTSPYRRAPASPLAPARRGGPTWIVGLLLVAGSVAVHAWVRSGAHRQRALQESWSEVATCVLGPPLGIDESPSSRLRERRLAAAAREVADAPGPERRRCVDAAARLRDALHPGDPEEGALHRELQHLDGADPERLVGAAMGLGLGHAGSARGRGREPPVVRAFDGAPLDRSLGSLDRVRVDPVAGPHPTLLFAEKALPRLCRWSTDDEPLDQVVCRDVAPSALGDSLGAVGRVMGGSLTDARVGVTRWPWGDGVFDPRDGSRIGPPSRRLAALRLDGAGLVVDDEGVVELLAPGAPARAVASVGAGTGLLMHRDLAWVRDEGRRMEARFIHVDDRGRAHVTEATGAGGGVLGCERDGTRAFVVGNRMVVADRGAPFGEAVALAPGDEGTARLACLPGGEAVVVAPAVREEPEGRRLVVVEERLSASGLVRREAVLAAGLGRTSEGDPIVADLAPVEGDVVSARASAGVGVDVRRGPIDAIAGARPALLVDDLEVPTRVVRLVTDGRGVVLLLDDGHVVRALRQRPDGSWVPQVATDE